MATDRVWHMSESGMRTKTFRPYDQDTLLLMPPSVRDWVDPDSLPAFISDLVDELDLGVFLAAHDEPRGMPPYHPAMMLKVLLYGYATGVRSSRKLEARCRSDVGFMFLAGNARPGHKAIGEFRRRHLTAFEALFLDILHLCQGAGLVTLGRVALDGTKLKADASKHKAMHGLTRSLIANMVEGVTEGFKRTLEIQGVGYRAEKKGKGLTLHLGYSHTIDYEAPEGVSLETPDQTTIVVEGIDKQQVGQTAAVIRGFRPPEPYKGKGVRYQGEYVRRKAGKTAGA